MLKSNNIISAHPFIHLLASPFEKGGGEKTAINGWTLITLCLLSILPGQLMANSVSPAMAPIISYLLSDSSTPSTPIPNQAPIARAGQNVNVAENRIVTLDGSNSSDDKAIVSYKWRDEYDLIGTSPTYTHIYALGSHAITLTVTDAEGLSHTDKVTVVVRETMGANAGSDLSIEPGETITIKGTYRGVKNARLFQWKEGQAQLSRNASFDYSSTVLGEHTLQFLIKDTGGNLTTDTMKVNVVLTQNQAPVADAGGNRVIKIHTTNTIQGKATDINNNIQSYKWLEDGTVISNSAQLSYTPSTLGQHILTLRVSDSDGAVSDDVISVEVIASSATIPNYSTPSYFTQNKLNIYPNTIQTYQANISKLSDISHERDDIYRGDNAQITKTGSTLKLINNSFNQYESMLAKYTQGSEEIFVKLFFSQTVKPFTQYKINSLQNGNKLEIVHTANMFNSNFEFNAKAGCESVIAAGGGLRKDRLCMPTPEEQEKLIVGLGNIHRLYNSVDTMKVFNAWGLKGRYKKTADNDVITTLDLSNFEKDCLNFKECRDASNLKNYIYKNLFLATVPNQNTKLKTIHYPSAAGWGDGFRPSIFGGTYGEGFGTVSINRYKFNEAFYMILHHEIMHGFGFSHQSSMTYGFSDALSRAIVKFYNYKVSPLNKMPKYVFKTKAIYKNKLLVTINSIAQDSGSKEFDIEIIGAQNNSYKIIPRANNSFVIELKDMLATRVFLRVIGDDSNEVMSKMLYPADFQVSEALFVDNGTKFSILTNKEWQYIRGHAVLGYSGMTAMETFKMCYGWFGDNYTMASGAETGLLYTTYTTEASELDSPFIIGRQFESDHKYGFKQYNFLDNTWNKLNSMVNVVDHNGHVLCKPFAK